MKKFITSLSIATMLASSLVAGQASKAEVMSLLEKTGTVKLSQQMFDQVFGMLAQDAKSQKEKDALEKFKNKIDVNSLIDELIPVYQKYYSSEDMKNLNKFYDTPTGQKLIKTMPNVARDSMNISQQWAQKIVEEVKAQSAKK